jgi:predicted transcriptional regulator
MVDHGDQVLTLATQIVTSHVSHNQMTSQDVVGFLNDVVKTLRKHQSGDDLPNVNAVNAKSEMIDETPLTTRAMKAFEGVTIKPRERGRPIGSKNKKTLAREMSQEQARQTESDQTGDLDADDGETVVDLRPAVPIKRSVFNDYIICLEDGKKI